MHAVIECTMQCKSLNPDTVKIVSALVQKMSTPEKVGGQDTGRPLYLKK